MTRRNLDGLPEGFSPGARVAVYLPMGYMIGGYTVFVPQEWVQPIQMSVEEAMRSSLIAWMARAEPSVRAPGDVPSAGNAPARQSAGRQWPGLTSAFLDISPCPSSNSPSRPAVRILK